MKHIADYTLKIVLLLFIFARFVAGPAPESPVATGALHEPSTNNKT